MFLSAKSTSLFDHVVFLARSCKLGQFLIFLLSKTEIPHELVIVLYVPAMADKTRMLQKHPLQLISVRFLMDYIQVENY